MSDTRTDTIRWLEERDPPPPFELQRRLVRAVERAPAGNTVTDLLIYSAMASLSNAMRIGDDRTAANDLLAADALLTYAVEAAAEEGIERLADVITQMQDAIRTLTHQSK